MADTYSENLGYWANSEAKADSVRRGSKALGNRRHARDNDAGLGRIEPVRLTFESSAAAQKSSSGQRAAADQGFGHAAQKAVEEVLAEELPADDTPTASLVDGVQTPDPPEQLTGQPGTHLQMPKDWVGPLGSSGIAPDVGDCQLADVALVWQECQNEHRARRRARTSVTSLYSSGAMEALMEDIKGQRAAADVQLAAARQEKAAADELAREAGYEGFRIQGQLLNSLESAVDRAAAAQSGKDQLRAELQSALAEVAATQEQQHHLTQRLQVAEQSVRVAAEQALQASQDEVQALSAKARRAEKRRKRLQATMEAFTEAAQQPILTHGQSLAASRGAWPGHIGGASAEAVLSTYGNPPEHMPDSMTSAQAKGMQASLSELSVMTQQSPTSSVPERQGAREVYRTPTSRLQRAGSTAESPGSYPASERRQLQREASAEALALEYEQSAGSGYEEEADMHLTPSRLLLRLREARAAAASAASGARRARAVASATEMRQAMAEAAEQRAGAALLAAEQRGHALDEQCRRLQAKLGRTEVELAQLRSQNEIALRDVALKAGAIKDLEAKCDSSRAITEDLQRHAGAVKEEAVIELSKHIKEAQRLEELREADAELLASQKEELAQLQACQTELQLAAVEREAAAQDLWVRLEAAEEDLRAEQQRGDHIAVQLTAAQQQLQELDRRLEEVETKLEASQKAVEASEEALQEQLADNVRIRDALESKNRTVSELEVRHTQLAAEAQLHQAASCRLEAALMAEQLRTAELARELEEGTAEQARLQAACACTQDRLEALQAKKADLLSRWQAMNGRTDRSVQDAEARLADVQTELMATQYDAHLASEALRSSQEHLSDLGFDLEDGENRLAELRAHCGHLEEQVAAADSLRAEAEARSTDLAVQVAEEQARGKKLAAKLAAARHASSSAPVRAELVSTEEAKRKAEQHAEHLRQKVLLLRKDMAAREAQLREEAAAARGEAEAAAQLVHALQPKGDFVLGTLWTKLMEAHARATQLPHKLPVSPPGRSDVEDTLDSLEEGAQKRHLVEIWAQLEAARTEAEEQKRQLATAQAQLAAGGSRGQKGQFEAPAAPSEDADGQHELCSYTAQKYSGEAHAESPLIGDLSWRGTPASDTQRHCADDSQLEPVSQQLTPPVSDEQATHGKTDSGNSSGACTPSEHSLPSVHEQSSFGGAQESPIRGLVVPGHPAGSRVIPENMERILCEDSPISGTDGSCWDFSHGGGGPDSLSDKASHLQSQPPDDIDGSAWSSGHPGEADSAVGALDDRSAGKQAGNTAEQAALRPAATGSSILPPRAARDADQASQDYGSRAEGAASSLSVDAEAADTADKNSSGHDVEGQASCSAASDSHAGVLVPVRQPAAALRCMAAVQQGRTARLLPRLHISAVHRIFLGGGVMLVAMVAAVRRRRGILQVFRFLRRAFAIYGHTMQWLHS